MKSHSWVSLKCLKQKVVANRLKINAKHIHTRSENNGHIILTIKWAIFCYVMCVRVCVCVESGIHNEDECESICNVANTHYDGGWLY